MHATHIYLALRIQKWRCARQDGCKCPEYRTSSLLPCGVLHTNAALAACYTHMLNSVRMMYTEAKSVAAVLLQTPWSCMCRAIILLLRHHHWLIRTVSSWHSSSMIALSVNNFLLNGREQSPTRSTARLVLRQPRRRPQKDSLRNLGAAKAPAVSCTCSHHGACSAV